jgi:hypothetical protein
MSVVRRRFANEGKAVVRFEPAAADFPQYLYDLADADIKAAKQVAEKAFEQAPFRCK